MRKMIRGLYMPHEVLVFTIIVCIASIASATLIDSGTVSLSAVSASSTSFNVQVDYKVYNGADSEDPLGDNGDTQITFVIEHLGGVGGVPAEAIGRFNVYEPTDWDQGVSGKFYNYYNYYDDPLNPDDVEAPHAPYGEMGYDTDVRYNFFYNDMSWNPVFDFVTGDVSQTLVVSTAAANLPDSIRIQIDETDTGIHDHEYIDIIVPEPASIALFGIGFSVLSIRRKQK
jgi:hypothetical protein